MQRKQQKQNQKKQSECILLEDGVTEMTRFYFQTGELESESKISIKDGKGTMCNFYKSGVIEFETGIIGSLPHGVGKHYYEEGPLREIVFYHHGVLQGIKHFTKEGFISKQESIKNGKRDGQTTIYYENTNIVQAQLNYENDMLHGIQRHFLREGRLVGEETFYNGKLHGSQLNYDDQGEVIKRTDYNKGKKTGFEYNKQTQVYTYRVNKQKLQFKVQPPQQIAECSICCKDFEEMQNPVALLCHKTHAFCLSCIQEHYNFRQDASCPLCRKAIE